MIFSHFSDSAPFKPMTMGMKISHPSTVMGPFGVVE